MVRSRSRFGPRGPAVPAPYTICLHDALPIWSPKDTLPLERRPRKGPHCLEDGQVDHEFSNRHTDRVLPCSAADNAKGEILDRKWRISGDRDVGSQGWVGCGVHGIEESDQTHRSQVVAGLIETATAERQHRVAPGQVDLRKWDTKRATRQLTVIETESRRVFLGNYLAHHVLVGSQVPGDEQVEKPVHGGLYARVEASHWVVQPGSELEGNTPGGSRCQDKGYLLNGRKSLRFQSTRSQLEAWRLTAPA